MPTALREFAASAGKPVASPWQMGITVGTPEVMMQEVEEPS